MKRILNHLATDWYKYLLELIVITAGVLGAFALNTWKEDRKQNNSAVIHLKVMYQDLKHDLVELEMLHRKMEDNMLASTTLLDQFKTILPVDTSTTRFLITLILEYNFDPITTGFNSLKDSESLSALDEDLQQKISKYYSTTEKITERESISNSFIKDQYEPTIFKSYPYIWNSQNSHTSQKLIYADDPREIKELDFDLFLGDKTLEVIVFARHYQTKVQRQFYANGIVELNEIIEILDLYDLKE